LWVFVSNILEVSTNLDGFREALALQLVQNMATGMNVA
jgi:hypothetical protein